MHKFILGRPRKKLPEIPREVVDACVADYLLKGGKITTLKPSPAFKMNWSTTVAVPEMGLSSQQLYEVFSDKEYNVEEDTYGV